MAVFELVIALLLVEAALSGVARHLKMPYPALLALAGSPPPVDGAYTDLLARTQRAERRALIALRGRGAIGDDAFHRVEEELDWGDLNAEVMARTV